MLENSTGSYGYLGPKSKVNLAKTENHGKKWKGGRPMCDSGFYMGWCWVLQRHRFIFDQIIR